MTSEPSTHRRNLFEVDNARNLSRHELADTFIPTQSFWRLLSAKHQVVLGARGQGKTALAKMLSHDHLVLLANHEPRAKSAVNSQEFIGIYLPTRLEWVGGLRNKPWLSEKEREEFFQWRLNVASCIAFVPVAKSCIQSYVSGPANQAKAERELALKLAGDWLPNDQSTFSDLLSLRRYLEDVDYHKQIQVLRERAMGEVPARESPIGIAFGMELFTPLRQAIKRLSRLLSLNENCSWLLCLDEAEFLEQMDHRIINSHMRAYPDNLFLKMTTMPYCHYTLATNVGAALVPGQDFAYVNMDSDRVLRARAFGETDVIGTQFGRTLFKKLLEASDPQIATSADRQPLSAREILGESELLDPRQEDWSPDSENMRLLARYGSRETVERARRLVGSRGFLPAIARKINGPLLLRKQVDELQGNKALTAYSGARMAIRCADDNPRHMIKTFNALLLARSNEQKWRASRRLPYEIRPEEQTRALRALSAMTLNQYRAFPKVGPQLHDFVTMIGEFMRADLHCSPLTTDQVTSVEIDDSISDEEWELVRVAVGHGLLHPNVSSSNPDEMPWREGVFHLAYALSPHFLLFPRRGKSAKLNTIRKFRAATDRAKRGGVKSSNDQPKLFDEGAKQ